MRNSSGIGAAKTAQIAGTALTIIAVLAFLLFALWNDAQCRQNPKCSSYESSNASAFENKSAKTLWQRTTDDPLVLYTALLAIFTAVLAVTSIAQGYFLLRAEGIARTTADAALKTASTAGTQADHLKSSAEQAERAATAMQNVADQMKAWVSEARDANETTRESLDLANREAVVNHPPRLIIHNIIAEKFGMVHRAVNGGAPTPGMPTIQVPGDPIKGVLYVRNVGGCAATITDSYGMVYILNGSTLPMRPPYHGELGNELFSNVRIPPGVSKEADFLDGKGATMDHWAGSQYVIFVMGWVDYQDDSEISRRVNFCRRFDRGDNRFVPVKNPDYEWEG